ncbi:hypothetical protein SNE40_021842 [Patella caerulea]|uniref:Translin-associated protein X n=1 Tax=Patella caerulea TaxID=87958 RepID=A0AAN8G4Z2_PATCE
MAGVNKEKRPEGRTKQFKKVNDNKNKVVVDENSAIIKIFRGFQGELDAKHDKHERLVKISRDVTIDSKRTIFLLHRHRDGSDREGNDEILNDAKDKIKEIQNIRFLAMAEELEGEDPYQFMRAISPGMQEYIEAISFYYYLKHGQLISLNEIQKDLVFSKTGEDEQNKILTLNVPPIEYLLGLADLTGELMRLTINSVGAGNLETPYKICEFLQIVYDAFNSYGNTLKDLNRKMGTLRQSLRKVENACYTLHVRGSEIPKHMFADVFMTSGDDKYAEDVE